MNLLEGFYDKLIDSFIKNVNNNYIDNYDEERFGQLSEKIESGLKRKIKELFLKNYISKADLQYYLHKFLLGIEKYSVQLNRIYDLLADDTSKELLIDIVSFRLLGHKKVKLKTNSIENEKVYKTIKSIEKNEDSIDPKFLHFKLYKYDLGFFGKNIQLYFTARGILCDFFLEQYSYKSEIIEISAMNGDIVIDAGGCWGDTALYFAERVGESGKVYSFEFIPDNLSIFKKNCDLNPGLKPRIKTISKPLWNESGKKVFYNNNGPASIVTFNDFDDADGETETITIDDFISANNIQRIDFIKMDIEGSELYALAGAKETIRKYKPKLAISIYHSWDDFVNIPQWIIDLNLGYKIYLGQYTIHAEETVIFATIK
ncbi:MAG: FkbM family methyltransferase [Bacteroidetes bacterium]|nr:FkbM family methyltransferase [Bacteroidota bacterium]